MWAHQSDHHQWTGLMGHLHTATQCWVFDQCCCLTGMELLTHRTPPLECTLGTHHHIWTQTHVCLQTMYCCCSVLGTWQLAATVHKTATSVAFVACRLSPFSVVHVHPASFSFFILHPSSAFLQYPLSPFLFDFSKRSIHTVLICRHLIIAQTKIENAPIHRCTLLFSLVCGHEEERARSCGGGWTST